jgi:serine/threonine protein kinase
MTRWVPEGAVDEVSAPLATGPRYASRRVLGRGGMGEVRLVADGAIGREVAFKVLSKELGQSNDARARFLREVRVQGRLEHPAIVPVYDAGLDADGNYFFSMKRITGQTLEALLLELGRGEGEAVARWSLAKLLGVFRHVCMAIDYAHSRGVVHRDLKPANVMIGDFGEVYVLDWGVAKVVAETEVLGDQSPVGLQTLHGEILGTPGYMAPEQIGNAVDADERSDIYALGAILFEILTLERLHKGKTVEEIFRSTRDGADARARARVPAREVPPELEAVCIRATANDAASRFATVHELTVAVERYAEGDRDLELRRRLARHHTEAAEAAAALALSGGARSNDERVRALGEAGRALALDPGVPAALNTIVKLLQSPPDDLPPEVRKEMEREELSLWVYAARRAAYIYGGFLVLCTSFLWLGVRSWLGLAAIVVPLGLAFVGCSHAAWVGGQSPAARFFRIPILIATASAIAGVSGMTGAIVLVPTLAVAVAAGGGLWVRPGLQRQVNLFANAGAILVPLLLEWGGILPRNYMFHGGAMTMLPVAVGFPEVPSRIAATLASVGALVGATIFVYHATDMLNSTRLRLALQGWQLRQLASVRDRKDSDSAGVA